MLVNNDCSNINLQIQNIEAQLENFRLFINKVNNTQHELIKNGIEIIYVGIQVLNTFMQIPYTGMEMIFNLNLQIQNIGLQLQNIGNQLQNYVNKPNIGIMPNLNVFIDQPFNQGNNMININNEKLYTPMKSVSFKDAIDGKIYAVALPFGSTVKNLIDKFYEKNPSYKSKKHLAFLYNACKINVNDMSKIENYFVGNPSIVLVTYDNIMGG